MVGRLSKLHYARRWWLETELIRKSMKPCGQTSVGFASTKLVQHNITTTTTLSKPYDIARCTEYSHHIRPWVRLLIVWCPDLLLGPHTMCFLSTARLAYRLKLSLGIEALNSHDLCLATGIVELLRCTPSRILAQNQRFRNTLCILLPVDSRLRYVGPRMASLAKTAHLLEGRRQLLLQDLISPGGSAIQLH